MYIRIHRSFPENVEFDFVIYQVKMLEDFFLFTDRNHPVRSPKMLTHLQSVHADAIQRLAQYSMLLFKYHAIIQIRVSGKFESMTQPQRIRVYILT